MRGCADETSREALFDLQDAEGYQLFYVEGMGSCTRLSPLLCVRQESESRGAWEVFGSVEQDDAGGGSWRE